MQCLLEELQIEGTPSFMWLLNVCVFVCVTCMGGLCSVGAVVLLVVGEPCLMMVGVTGLAMMGAPGVCRENMVEGNEHVSH